MKAKKFLWRFLAILASGALPTFFEWSLGETNPRVLFTDTVIGVCFAAAIGSLCWLVLPRVAARILKQPTTFKWTYLIGTIVTLATAGCFLALTLLIAVGFVPTRDFGRIFSHSLRLCILITLGFGLAAFFYEVITSRLNAATAALQAKELAEERLRQAATEARLSSLESRVHPHFLFNTLNSITALIREDPVLAERMVERLAALLRFSLDSSGARLVSLDQELSTVRNYLEIEKVRFGHRLRYTIEIEPGMGHLEIPPMSVQTIVENSVKYAVSPRREGAEILIRAQMRGKVPAVDVIDDGPGFGTGDLKSGHGLDLLQSRLASQFGSDSGVELGRDPGATRVTVLLPQRVEALV